MDNSKRILKSQYQTGEILVDDSKTGKKRDWKRYKEQSLAVSEAYFSLGELMEYGEKMHHCGSRLHFKGCEKGHEKKLFNADFCKGRGCPMCQSRKSLAIFSQVLELAHAHRARYSSDIPLLLTLTIPNVSAAELKMMLDKMQKSWDKMTKRAKFKRSIRSWFRSLEVTYNVEKDTYHPHFHVLLMVPLHYFTRERELYIDRNEWLSMWQESMGMSEITQVDIRRVRKQNKNKPLEAIAAEVAKYATKPSNYIEESPNGDFKALPEVIKTLHYALKSRRLIAFGGLFKELRKILKQVDIEKANLDDIDDQIKLCTCSICQSDLIDMFFNWDKKRRQYIA